MTMSMIDDDDDRWCTDDEQMTMAITTTKKDEWGVMTMKMTMTIIKKEEIREDEHMALPFRNCLYRWPLEIQSR